jgi:hypothetical protein
VLFVRSLCVALIFRPAESYVGVVSKCDRQSSIMRKYWPSGAVASWLWSGAVCGICVMTVHLHGT